MRSVRVLSVLAAAGASALAVAGCQDLTLNGTTNTGAIIGATYQVGGYYTGPNVPVQVQVLNDPTLDTSVAANWTTIGTATSANTANVYFGDSEYAWSTNVVPVPNAGFLARWPAGGLVKMRAIFLDGGNTYTGLSFDTTTWGSCLGTQLNLGTGGYTIGERCEGVGANVFAVVSTQNNPADLGNRDFLSNKGDITQAETLNYYNTWGAPATLPAFKTAFGYPGGGDQTVTYYNDTDLGVGREMHCWQSAAGGTSFTACYVSNYSDTPGVGKFGTNNVTTALANAVARNGAFATVAMVYAQSGAGRGTVNFVVYGPGPGFARVNTAKLDNLGVHVSVPNNCLTCHGVDAFYDPGSHSISGAAQFLPFAVTDFQYSTAGGFTRAAQEGTFYNLNQMVKNSTQPTTAITNLVNGAYNGGTTWNDNYIPSDWTSASSTQAYETLYTGVVRQYCRGCHLSAGTGRDLETVTNFNAEQANIKSRACQSSLSGYFMPHAEHPMRKFWASGARAFLNEWTADNTGCKP